jgi:DNA-directed RNA polymerase subunit RPC12/RpoP
MFEESTKPWICKGCGRERPACDGSDDEMPGYCDRCWARAEGDQDAPDHSCPRCQPELWARGMPDGSFGRD